MGTLYFPLTANYFALRSVLLFIFPTFEERLFSGGETHSAETFILKRIISFKVHTTHTLLYSFPIIIFLDDRLCIFLTLKWK